MTRGSGESGAGDNQQTFLWPPRQISDAPRMDAPAQQSTAIPIDKASSRAWRSRLADVIWEAERAWLVPTAAPLARRVADIGWIADAVHAYCNRCGETVGPFETAEFGCSACVGRRFGWDRFVRLGAHEGALREWVHEVKFLRNARLGYELGRELGARLREAGVGSQGPVSVVPTPAHWTRRVTRGVDHAGVIALGVGGELRAPVVQALGRRWGASQRSVPTSERARNVSRVFRARRCRERLQGTTVVVVDDVRTTGATLRACVRALRRTSESASFLGVWAGVVGVASHVVVGVAGGGPEGEKGPGVGGNGVVVHGGSGAA